MTLLTIDSLPNDQLPAGLRPRMDALQHLLHSHQVSRVCVDLDNGEDWLALDLACVAGKVVQIAYPAFFSAAQQQHLLNTSSVAHVVCDQQRMPRWKPHGFELIGQWGRVYLLARSVAQVHRLPADCSKITYTSGTTARPKGVCLTARHLNQVAHSLAEQTTDLGVSRYLCALPLSVLLENVGLYASLLAGAELCLPSLSELGWNGSSRFDAAALIRQIRRYDTDSLILLPEMLRTLVSTLEQTSEQLESLRYVAVGGSRVAPDLIQRARDLGVPAHEGYGLSECGSVVAVNVPGHDRPGSVGRVLDHQQVRIADDGEIIITGAVAAGYLTDSEPGLVPLSTPFASGDLGHLDDDGFLTVDGRKKNLLITSFGRNVSPEWVESECLVERGMLQVVVVGDGKPFLSALVHAPSMTHRQLANAFERINARLPDYAQLRRWIILDAPLSSENGLMTANGRPRRAAIMTAFETPISQQYREVA